MRWSLNWNWSATKLWDCTKWVCRDSYCALIDGANVSDAQLSNWCRILIFTQFQETVHSISISANSDIATNRFKCRVPARCLIGAGFAPRATNSLWGNPGSKSEGLLVPQQEQTHEQIKAALTKLSHHSRNEPWSSFPKNSKWPRWNILATRPRRFVGGMAGPTGLLGRDLIWRCLGLCRIEGKRRTCDQDRRRDRRCTHNRPLHITVWSRRSLDVLHCSSPSSS